MGEFRIGRRYAQHAYPDSPRGGTALEFARNFASGPASAQPVSLTPGTQVDWSSVDVPDGAPDEDVPITPLSTGVIRVLGTITVQNTTANPMDVQLQVLLDDVAQPLPATEHVTIQPTNVGESIEGFEAIPFMVEISGLVIGVERLVQIRLIALTSPGVEIAAGASTLEVQEVPISTG